MIGLFTGLLLLLRPLPEYPPDTGGNGLVDSLAQLESLSVKLPAKLVALIHGANGQFKEYCDKIE